MMRFVSCILPRYQPILGQPEHPLHFGQDISFYYISPFQSWLNSFIAQAWKLGAISNQWLPDLHQSNKHREAVRALLSLSNPMRAIIYRPDVLGMLMLGGLFEIFAATTSLVAPLLLRQLLLEPTGQSVIGPLLVVTVLSGLTRCSRDQICRVQSVHVQSILRRFIFSKGLRLPADERISYPPERLINMCTVDTETVGTYTLKIHEIWSAPLQLVAIVVLIFRIMGRSGCYGFAFMIVVFAVGQRWVNKALRHTFASYITQNDRRLGILRAVLYHIKSIQALVYESVFERIITDIRQPQMVALKARLSIMFGYFIALNLTIPALTAAVAFLAYYLTGNELTPAVVFPSLTYFSMLQQPLSQTSLAIARQSFTMPSFLRIWELVKAKEVRGGARVRMKDGPTAVHFEDSSFFQLGSSNSVLDVGSLDVPRGRLTAITGPTGAGKSSLLRAILGELVPRSGNYYVHGTIAYSAQEPWILPGTLQENIVFTSSFDPVWYEEVVAICGLEYDFQHYPRTDQMQVTHGGRNLSGGQRARLSLARALYARRDIILLDEPFAALDYPMAEMIFKRIRCLGFTIVIVTRSVPFIAKSDYIVIIDQNRVVWAGCGLEAPLRSSRGSEYLHDIVRQLESATASRTDKVIVAKQGTAMDMVQTDTRALTSNPSLINVKKAEEEEQPAAGSVPLAIFEFYARQAGGLRVVVPLTIGLALAITSHIVSSYWFVWWTGNTLQLEKMQYVAGYLGITVLQTVIRAGLAATLVFGSIRASRNIHAQITKSLLTAPLWFFERHSAGTILNRLSTDLESVDTKVMNAVDMALSAISTFAASLYLVASSSLVMVVPLLPFVLIVGWLQSRFRCTSCAREVQRAALALRSPALSIMNTSLFHVSSILAFDATDMFVEKYNSATDVLMSAETVRKSLDTWLSLRTELASALLLLMSMVCVVYGSMPPEVAGLALSTILALARNVSTLIWTLTELEIKLIPVERLQEYCEDVSRADCLSLSRCRPSPTCWPTGNDVEVKGVSFTYPSRTVRALDNVTLRIRAGEKLGILGQSGSGKSTLFAAISRLVDPTHGIVTIGGIDTRAIEKQSLRNVVCLLPQEPLIFEGTVRENLDPNNLYSDQAILEAVKTCKFELQYDTTSHANILTVPLRFDGSAMSIGQRQLLCAVRVLLAEPSVLLIDEGANIDSNSEIALQHAFCCLPPGTTIVIIAHKSSTLSWVDRTITMAHGRIVDGTAIDLHEDVILRSEPVT